MTYFKQLDGLRFIAVILTLIAHWFPAVGWPMIPYSWNGVDLFFFAITGFFNYENRNNHSILQWVNSQFHRQTLLFII